jgi:hypothetical protein
MADIGADIARRALVEPYQPDESGLARLREVNAAAILHLLDCGALSSDGPA